MLRCELEAQGKYRFGAPTAKTARFEDTRAVGAKHRPPPSSPRTAARCAPGPLTPRRAPWRRTAPHRRRPRRPNGKW